MAEISASMRFTLQVRPYETAAFELGVSGINPEGDVDAQLAATRDAVQKATDYLEERLYEQIVASGLLKAAKERPVPKK